MSEFTAEFTIVKNNIVDNVIEADDGFMLKNFNNDVVIRGRFPIGHVFKGDHFVPPEMTIIPATDFVGTDASLVYKEVPDTYLHKAWFKERLLPFAADIKTARAADAKLDAYFDLLAEYKGIDVTWNKTQLMLNDAEARIKAVVPGSLISAANLLLPRQPLEVYRIDGAQ